MGLAKEQCFHFTPPLEGKCKGIIGYSGAYLEGPLTENIIKNDILLIHGQIDPIVPLERMKQAEQKLKNLSSTLETKIYEQLEHSINEEGLEARL